jgi:hypothetical protein
MYATHRSQLPVLSLSLILDPQSQQGRLMFPTYLPTSTLTSASAFHTSAPLHARSYTRLPCTLAFALAPLSHPRIAPNLPLALRQMPTFGVVGTFAASTSQPCPPTPRTAPALRVRQTVTSRLARPHVRCFYILDTGRYSTLELCLDSVCQARTSASCSSLCTSCAPPTSVLHTFHVTPPPP